MQFRSSVRRKKFEVSLIPLINVIFLLLIFFMVAGTVEGIEIFEVELPVAKQIKNKPQINAVIYLGTDNRIAINNDHVLQKDLKTIISTLFIDNPKQKITIKSDASIPAQKLISVMNMIEESGGEDIFLVTQGQE